LKQHISAAGFVGCVPTDAPTRKKTGWDDKHQIGTGCTNWFHMGMSFLQTGTIRYGMDAFRALQVLFPARKSSWEIKSSFFAYHYFTTIVPLT
jgi:hypothetical protein